MRGFGGRRGGGRGNFGGRGGNFGRKGRGSYGGDQGPPDNIIEVGTYLHSAEDDLVVKLTISKIPYSNAFVYLENKSSIGKIDEIFGPIYNPYFSVKLVSGFHASSFDKSQKLFMDPAKLLPLERFLPGSTPSRTRGSTASRGRASSGMARGSSFGKRATGGRGGFGQRGNRPRENQRGRGFRFGNSQKFRN